MESTNYEASEKYLRFDYGKQEVNTESIKYIESVFGNYTNIQFDNKKPYCSAFTLKHYKEKLCNTEFVQIRKGLLVNSKFLVKIEKVKGQNWVELKTGEKFKVSRRCGKLLFNS